MKTKETQEKERLGLVWLPFEMMHKVSLLPYNPPDWNQKKMHLSLRHFPNNSALGTKSVPHSTVS